MGTKGKYKDGEMTFGNFEKKQREKTKINRHLA